ncbi:alpha/beta hydrolase [Gymnodinialimonas hymeniacidonis]|uniref:alpha/beta hydrolase n=1 Tax=Gymnodinialimonas hymeniacidonis TaxID=3126508 RepID=UPI0034C65579
MSDAPYPGLAPDLWDLVADMAADPNPVPEHERPLETLRAAVARMEATLPPLPQSIKTCDWTISCNGRDVPLRSYTSPKRAKGTMLYFHGGGWVLGSLKGHDLVCADLALETGLTIVSIDYALSPEHPYPAALKEGLAAIAHLAEQGPLWLGGDSAGANLALGCALHLRDHNAPVPDGLFLIYPATDRTCASPSHTHHARAPYLSTKVMHRCWHEYLGATADAPYADIAHSNLQGLPQSVILTAELDPLVDEGDALARAIAGHATVWHEQAKGLIHGFLRFRATSPTSDAAFRRAARALADRLT